MWMNTGKDESECRPMTCPKPVLNSAHLLNNTKTQKEMRNTKFRQQISPTLRLSTRMPIATMATRITPLLLFIFLLKLGHSSGWGIVDGSTPADGDLYSDTGGTIGFSTLGRLHFDFDVYTLKLPLDVLDDHLSLHRELHAYEESCVTYRDSVSYNAQLVETDATSAFVERLQANGHEIEADDRQNGVEVVVYVSEVEGSPQIYIDIPLGDNRQQGRLLTRDRRITLRRSAAAAIVEAPPKTFLNDRPSMIGDTVVYVSTEEDVGKPRQGWNGIYSTNFRTSITKRLSPPGVTDYSPAVSPSGEWVAVASNEGRGWKGEFEILDLDLYVFKAHDGSERRLVCENAGWPTWADETIVFFHRLADDGWFSIYKVDVSASSSDQEPERITPPGVHTFTPAASRCGKWIAVATRRSLYRHIEIFDLQAHRFLSLTELINPKTHHYNPFVSSNSGKLGYHRCRGKHHVHDDGVDPFVEYVKSPLYNVTLGRFDGSFASMSPDGSWVAYVDEDDEDVGYLSVMKLDGTKKRRVYRGPIFGTAWDPMRQGRVYTSQGPMFASEEASVHIVAVSNVDTADIDHDEAETSFVKFLTKEGSLNNAFPSPSPDGKFVVFRSGRTGHKNLYIMDAGDGEEKYLRRLTEGEFQDTMPAWSPNNNWITFVSNRHNPTERTFALYLIRPDGTDLHMILSSAEGGLINHPQFSPDGTSIVFTTDYAGVSAEPISLPFSFQPYGEIFVVKIDGSGLRRVTHNFYEDGTPYWGQLHLLKSTISGDGNTAGCDFEDVRFLKAAAGARSHSCFG